MPLLIDKFKEIFLEEFSKLDIDSVKDYTKKNREMILFLCNYDNALNKEIEEMLGRFIIKKVRENYYPKLLGGCDYEVLPNLEYLAYALQKNSFSFDELRRVNL